MFRVSGCVFPLALGFHLVEPHQPAHSPHLMAIQLAVFKTGSLNESLPQHLLTSVSASPFMFYEKSLYFCFANFAVLCLQFSLDHLLTFAVQARFSWMLFISVHSQSRPTLTPWTTTHFQRPPVSFMLTAPCTRLSPQFTVYALYVKCLLRKTLSLRLNLHFGSTLSLWSFLSK